MKKTILLALIAMMTLVSFASDNDIIITGSTTVLPIAQATAETFMENNSDANITVKGGGSGVGIAALIDGTCDIANASRDIKESEVEKAQSSGINPIDFQVALDAIAVVVNPGVNLDNLTIEQLASIYKGEITNWKALGGADEKIVVISRDISSGTYEVFENKVMNKAHVSDKAMKVASNQAVATTVANTPNSIGYIGLGYISPKVKPISINNVQPTDENAKNGTYSIVRSLHMYTNGTPSGTLKEFIDFIMSDDGQKVVVELGYVSVK